MTTTIEAPVTVEDDVQPENRTLAAVTAVQQIFDEYLVFPSAEARDAVVLWALHAHVFRAFESTPRLSVRSAEPGSGKSRVLEVLEHLVPNPMVAVYLTPGVMWRMIENGAPTMMLDEADTIFGKNGSGSAHAHLRGIINAGHRKGATVPRCVGAEDVKQFHVFAPVALAGLGRLPETISSRSVEIVMRRRRKGDPEIRPFRLKFAAPALRKAYDLCEMWAQRNFADLQMALPELPVKDRNADVWEPLVSIADLAGPEWGERAREACKRLTEDANKAPVSVGVQLLMDLKEIFTDDEQLFTCDVLQALYAMDSIWDPDTFEARKLSRLLAEYGVAPVMLRMGDRTARGYRRSALSDAWSRYLPEPEPEKPQEGA